MSDDRSTDQLGDEKLRVEGVTVAYGGNRAIEDVSFSIRGGEILAIIGPNGAGKTTLLNAICGIVKAQEGKVFLRGRDVSRRPFHARCRMGLSRTFQVPKASVTATLEEQVAVQIHDFRIARRNARVGEILLRVLRQSRILGVRSRRTDQITLGEYRLFELARAEAREPSVLLVDEGASGTGYAEADVLAEELRSSAERGIAVVLVEHNIPFVRKVADRILVLNLGKVIAEGEPSEVLSLQSVREAYLGTAAA